MSIRLSKEHGVNPSLMMCFFCCEAKGVALLGAFGGKKAPREIVLDYEPCDACSEKFKKGILFIEANDFPNDEDQPPLSEGVYPTGRWAVCTPNVLDMFKDVPKDLDTYAIDPETANKMGIFDDKRWEGLEEH